MLSTISGFKSVLVSPKLERSLLDKKASVFADAVTITSYFLNVCLKTVLVPKANAKCFL